MAVEYNKRHLLTIYVVLALFYYGYAKTNSNELVVNALRDGKSCLFHASDLFYDLSSISGKDFWLQTEPHTENTERIFVISICHPVRAIPSCQNSSSCFSKIPSVAGVNKFNRTLNKIMFKSIGKFEDKTPEVVDKGSLIYKYNSLDNCILSETRNVSYETQIYLKCPHEFEEETDGPILMSSPNCMFIFVWVTYAACPVELLRLDDVCKIKLSNSLYPIDLQSLSSPTYYNVSHEKGLFEINVCGKINNGKCGEGSVLCDLTNASLPVTLATTESKEISLINSTIVIIYYNKFKNVSSNIHLYCDRSEHSPRIYFNGKSDNSYNFSLFSMNVCPPKVYSCILLDEELNIIDLRPTHNSQSNYVIIGKEPYFKSGTYYLNMCGPLNKPEDSNCPSGPIGACFVNDSASYGVNLGYMVASPLVNKDGSITILYSGGDKCSSSNPTPLSTSITMICSHITIGPFLTTVDRVLCRHYFTWFTPSACPRKVIQSPGCVITDPLYGHTFDFKSLRNEVKDYIVEFGDNSTSFRINVCGPLLKPCETTNSLTPTGNDNTTPAPSLVEDSVCVETKTAVASGGKVNSELVFNDGSLLMTFPDGDECKFLYNGRWSTRILFVCAHSPSGTKASTDSHNEESKSNPVHMYSDHSSCVHHFLWQTPMACPPHEVVDCSVVHEGKKFDLNPLSSSTSNEYYHDFSGGERKFILNFCRSVVHSKESRCPYFAGACLIDERRNVSLNLGRVVSGPVYEGGALKIRYEDGDVCSNSSGSVKKYSTIIEFECSYENNLFSAPILVIEENCINVFIYKTPVACPSSITPEVSGWTNCSVSNPLTGFVFDLQPLSDPTPKTLRISANQSLLLSVCGEVKDERCPANAGSCLITTNIHSGLAETGVSAGRLNRTLRLSDRFMPILTYSDGANCPDGRLGRTKIYFVCSAEDPVPSDLAFSDLLPLDKLSGPYIASARDETCTHTIHWFTRLACETELTCLAASSEMKYDLSPLVRAEDNYEINDTKPQSSGGSFILNVCQPIRPSSSAAAKCSAGSNICYIHPDGSALSLGRLATRPRVISSEEILFLFSHGSQCPSNTAIKISSSVRLICNASAHFGQPEFVKVTNDCTYEFKWMTAFICPPKESPMKDTCRIQSTLSEAFVDLSPLAQFGPYNVDFEGRMFRIGLCGSSDCDGGAVVCHRTEGDDSVGYGDETDLVWDHSTLVMTSHGGSECSGSLVGTRLVKIFFECSLSAGYGSPQADPIMSEVSCVAVFNWRTNLTCPGVIPPSASVIPVTSSPQPQTTPSTTSLLSTFPSSASTTSPQLPSTSTDVSITTPGASAAGNASSSPSSTPPGGISGVWIFMVVLVTITLAAFVAVLLLRTGVGRRFYERVRQSAHRSGYVKTTSGDDPSLLSELEVYHHVEDASITL